jgi:hypothetical protein
MDKEEIKKEAEQYIDKVAPYWLRAERQDRESSIEEFTEFAYLILNKSKPPVKRTNCHCGQPIDFSNIDCESFNLCKDCAMDS